MLDTPLNRDLLREQEALRRVIEDISGELELRPLLTKIVRHACDLLGADRGTIGLVVGARHLVRTEAAFNMPAGELGLEMAPGEGLAGKVLETGSPVLLQSYSGVDRPVHADLAEDAVVGLPIWWRGEMIGFFGIGADPPRHFSEADVATLELFSRHAAIAIQNARLFAESATALSDMQLLYESSQRISMAMDVDSVVNAYLQQVATQRRYRCSVAYFELEDGERKRISLLGRWVPGTGGDDRTL